MQASYIIKKRIDALDGLLIALIILPLCVLLYHAAQIPAHTSIITDPTDASWMAFNMQAALVHHSASNWWHGPWVGENQFYRPLPSLFWYGLYCMFGSEGLREFQIAHYLWHGAFLLSAFFTISQFFGRRIALFAVAIFSTGALDFLGLASSSYALRGWIDTVEPEWGTFFLFSLLFFDKFLQIAKLPAFALSLLCFMVGTLCKEATYMLPAALIGLLWYRQRLALYKISIPFFVWVGGVALYRAFLFHGRGSHFGSNHSWLSRTLVAVIGGAPAERFLEHDLIPAILVCVTVACLALGLSRAPRVSVRRWLPPILLLAMALIMLLYVAQFSGTDIVTAAFMPFISGKNGSLSPEFWWAAQLAIVLLLWRGILSLSFLREKVLIALLVFLTFLPPMTAYVTEHVNYVPAIWWACLATFALKELWHFRWQSKSMIWGTILC